MIASAPYRQLYNTGQILPQKHLFSVCKYLFNIMSYTLSHSCQKCRTGQARKFILYEQTDLQGLLCVYSQISYRQSPFNCKVKKAFPTSYTRLAFQNTRRI